MRPRSQSAGNKGDSLQPGRRVTQRARLCDTRNGRTMGQRETLAVFFEYFVVKIPR